MPPDAPPGAYGFYSHPGAERYVIKEDRDGTQLSVNVSELELAYPYTETRRNVVGYEDEEIVIGPIPFSSRARQNPIHGARRNPGATLASSSTRRPPALNPPRYPSTPETLGSSWSLDGIRLRLRHHPGSRKPYTVETPWQLLGEYSTLEQAKRHYESAQMHDFKRARKNHKLRRSKP